MTFSILSVDLLQPTPEMKAEGLYDDPVYDSLGTPTPQPQESRQLPPFRGSKGPPPPRASQELPPTVPNDGSGTYQVPPAQIDAGEDGVYQVKPNNGQK